MLASIIKIQSEDFDFASATDPSRDPTLTVSPSLTTTFSRIPFIGDGTSTFTLSVSNSTIGSSEETLSPLRKSA